MEDLIKSTMDKISSYDVFNNFLPGIVFCYLVERTTDFNFINGTILEKLFVYYFVGVVISRIGSVWIETILRKIEITNRNNGEREKFLKTVPYEKYEIASMAKPKIIILSEKNNVYRTILSMLIVLFGVKLYEVSLYNWINSMFSDGEKISHFVLLIILIILFLFSYKKQTDYIIKSVENHFVDNK